MVKTLVSLTDRQMKALAYDSEALEISKSEYLRRIMDRYLGTGEKITKSDILLQKIAEKRIKTKARRDRIAKTIAMKKAEKKVEF